MKFFDGDVEIPAKNAVETHFTSLPAAERELPGGKFFS